MATAQGDENVLPNRPNAKLPSIAKGARIHKRPLLGRFPNQRRRNIKSNSSGSQTDTNSRPTRAKTPSSTPPGQRGPDGYAPPPRAPHTAVIYVSSRASFMSLVKRVRRALDSGPQRTRGLPLTARVAALGVSSSPSAFLAARRNDGGEGAPPTASLVKSAAEDALDDVVLIATGRAIQRTVEVGAFLTRDRALAVIPRTRTVHAVDDVIVAVPARRRQRQHRQPKSGRNSRDNRQGVDDGEDEEMGAGEGEEGGDEGEEEESEEGEDQVRVRNVSCLEVGVRWRTMA